MTMELGKFGLNVSRLRNRAFFLSDLVLLVGCAYAAFAARFEGVSWTSDVSNALQAFLTLALPVKLILLISLGMYRRLWRYASVADLEMLVLASAAMFVADMAIGLLVLPLSGLVSGRLSYSVLLLDTCLGALAIAFPRLTARVASRRERRPRKEQGYRAIVVGAGAAGGMIARELAENGQLGIRPIAFLDDDSSKHGLRLHNVPVKGGVRDLARVAASMEATHVIIAMPSASGRTVRDVVRQASEAGLATQTVPGLYELLSGEKRVNALRKIEIQDLLRREPIHTDVAQVASLVRGRTVMVTGAGGSIGSELCRQLARLEPAKIVALGRGENSIFELLQEFGRSFPHVLIEPVIADVRDYARMSRVLSAHRPFSVFHAAAHKHVPLMEANVAEAVLNNVLGTKNVVTLCSQNDVEHFVLISTDKAVRPTSVMGATKRLAEHLVHEQAVGRKSGYVSVRFGNVLGSRGSVVPTFMRQIADGGPVTITHPQMTRYFMTIPEAVQLVLQSAALGDQGEVFVLDMGEPIKVSDLATDLIRLSGLEPGIDIDIRYTGTRPGEKLFEELFFQGADVTPTIHPKILRARDAEAMQHSDADIELLIKAARENRSAATIRRLILKLVPEYAGVLDTGEFAIMKEGEVLDELSSQGEGTNGRGPSSRVRAGAVAEDARFAREVGERSIRA